MFRFNRHVEMAHAIRRKRVHNGGDDGRSCADSAGFANALYAHGVYVGRRLGAIEFEPGDHRGLGQCVIHECAAHKLALFVVDHLFIECLANGLNDASLDLAIDQHWVDDVAAIIYGDVTLEVDLTGFGVEFDYSDMSSKGEGEILRLEEVNGRKSGLHV